MTSFVELLRSTKVEDIPKGKEEIITISGKETPVQGFEKLIKNNVLAAPVFDETNNTFTGFLDIRDLISYAVFAFENHDKVDTYRKGESALYTLVDDVTVTYLSRRNPFHSVKPGDSLLDVAKLLSKPGVHRVPVVNPQTGAVVQIISQSSFIQLFAKHLKQELAGDAAKTVAELNLGSSPVITVKTTNKTIDVFRLLDNTKRTAVGVVEESGDIIGNVSGKDLKLFISNNQSYDLLNMPIMGFLSRIRDENIDITAPTFCVCEHDPLALLIGKLAATRVHRIYVTKSAEDYKPVRVVSITDILRTVLKLGENH
eukprot:TRINITY_DN1269_c0_g3_i1.p1 TRINITY_DN1269_c0_g3~~TRINITY_DN1269_c0_g3_i1.p1  ORF type:complete len:314 (-),score=57.67 TRINITY_DN1269_c0_g3_i1:193-1134(-)